MNPAIAALIKMLGIDPQQLEQMVNGSQQILADFDNRLKTALVGIETLLTQLKKIERSQEQILTLITGLKHERSLPNGSASGFNQPGADDIAPGRSGGG